MFRDQKPTACFFSSFVGDFCNFCHFLVLQTQRERSGLEIQKPSACSFHQMCFGLHRAQIFFGLLFPKTFLGQK
jgi:hypothetical protein